MFGLQKDIDRLSDLQKEVDRWAILQKEVDTHGTSYEFSIKVSTLHVSLENKEKPLEEAKTST